LKCKDEQILGVSKEQTERICKTCQFFDSCLNGDMIESTSRIITKPDWSLAIARHIVQLLVTSRTTLPSLKDYEEFMTQVDFLVVDARLCSFVNYMDTTLNRETKFLELADRKYYRFSLDGNVTSREWLQLLEREVLLNSTDRHYVVQIPKSDSEREAELSQEQVIARHEELDGLENQFQVHARFSIYAMMMIQQCLQGEDTNPIDTSESISSLPQDGRLTLYLYTESPLSENHCAIITSLTGEHPLLAEQQEEEPRQWKYMLQASANILLRMLEPLKHDENVDSCVLCVDSPSPDMLGRLVNAILQDEIASRFRGSIGLDATLNRYFCNKPIDEILLILKHLADFSNPATINGSFTVYLQMTEQETGAF